jgi:hypothetical protein
MDFVKSLFGAKKNVPAANIRMNNRKNMVPAPAANMMVVAPPAPVAGNAPVPANAPQQFGGRKRTRKNKKNRKARKASRKNRTASC